MVGIWIWLSQLPVKVFGLFSGLELYANFKTYETLRRKFEFDKSLANELKVARRGFFVAVIRLFLFWGCVPVAISWLTA